VGTRARWRAIPTGERVEIALAALCVVLAYVALATGAHGWRLWLPQLAAAVLCLRLAWRHWRH
jgi:hypothetical protein